MRTLQLFLGKELNLRWEKSEKEVSLSEVQRKLKAVDGCGYYYIHRRW